ncbi:MAG: OmpH family outer membrane protein [Planctomycetes bacterium]|nr:OmpH family outer membrane protein [Planctomycetota bacterium]
MRKLILTATGFVFLTGATYLLSPASGQDRAAKSAPAEDPSAPHRIGVIDVDYIWEKYDKVKVELEELKAEIQATEEKLKTMQRNGQEAFEEYKTLKDGTAEKKAKEEKLNQMQALFDAKRKTFQNELKREQAKLQLTIYQEIQDAVKTVANHNNITLVVKVSRNEAGSISDPARTQAMLGQPCIYHRKQDDMTDTVLNLLNKRYNQANPDAAGKVTPAGASEDAGTKKKPKVKTADGAKKAD